MSVSVTPQPVPVGSVKLSGTVIGTAGSYRNLGNTIANVFDANVNSYFDAPAANGGWAGLDLGSPKTVTQIQFVPRSGYGSRMAGGLFQASTTADFSAGVTTLYTVPTTPAAGQYTVAAVTPVGAFEFVRYLAPANGYGNVAEVEFDGLAAAPVSAPAAPAMPVVVAGYAGAQLSWQQDPTIETDSFTVQRQGPTDAAFVTIGTTTGGVFNFNDPAAAASTTYSYQVIANNVVGSTPSPVVTATTPAPFANPWVDTDIGSVAKPGTAVVNPAGPIIVTGGGADIWNQTDAFNFEHQTMTGNGTVTVQVTSQTNTSGWAKSGIMIRESTNADSRFVLLALTPGNGVTMQARSATHTTPTMSVTTPGRAGVWLQLQRVGTTFTGSVSTDGINWQPVGTINLPMVNNVQAGLCVTAHDNTKISSAVFNNVAVTTTGAAASIWTDAATAPMTRGNRRTSPTTANCTPSAGSSTARWTRRPSATCTTRPPIVGRT